MIINEKQLLKKLNKINIDKDKYNIFLAKDNNPSLNINTDKFNFYLTSKYNPEKEGLKFAQNNYTENTILLYGIGMGYHIQHIVEMLKEEQEFYILECNLELVKIAFENTNIKNILKNNKNICFLASENLEEINSFIQKILKNNVIPIFHEPSLRIMPENMIELKDIFEKFVISAKTFSIHADSITKNLEYNLSKNYPNGGKLFKDKYKGKTCIIVSAGPSLEMNVNELAEFRDKLFIIAVSRTSATLQKHNIKPDIYITIENKDSTMAFLNRIKDKTTPLFFLSTATKLVETYPGEKYILFEKQGASEEDKSYAIESGGSVATSALSLGVLMGFNPIMLIGQDLSVWSKNKLHSNERFVEIKQIKGGKYVESIDGETYYTLPNLYTYLKWIERFISRNPETKFINCTAKGAKINGAYHMQLKEYFANLS